jgi:16S rRNA (guanine527-N7)-methyltransferase
MQSTASDFASDRDDELEDEVLAAAEGAEDELEGEPAAEAPPEDPNAHEDVPNPELASKPIPSEAQLKEALDWAFQAEEVLPGVLASYAKHARLVLEANREINLTALIDAKEVAVKHYLDSWRATRLLPLMGRRVLDLGSGGGYPGMPTALCEDMTKVVLIDARRKKAEFMQSIIEEMGVKNATAEWGRGEEYLQRNKVDVVFIRALSSVRENVRLLRKVRHSFHDLVMFKGPSWSREVRAGEREAERLGFRLDTVWEHELPGEMGKRAILIYRAPGAQ